MDLEGAGGSRYSLSARSVDLFQLKCDTGFPVLGLLQAEAVGTPIRVICTLITMSVASAWIMHRHSIKRLFLFFSHWLSGTLHLLALLVQETMISVCWAGANLTIFIKVLKFVEVASSNMLALMNLAICGNLAVVVMSHRSLSRAKSLNTPMVVFVSFVLSTGVAAAAVAFWVDIGLIATKFVVFAQEGTNWMTLFFFLSEFIVGVCMFVIVAWLLWFRTNEVKECWMSHSRIRYYFGLTLVGTFVNLGRGVFGTIYIVGGSEDHSIPTKSWALRYIHIAVNTFVLYGVLAAPAKRKDGRPLFSGHNSSRVCSGRTSS